MTKKWSSLLMAFVLVVTTVGASIASFDAEARRMSGGSSFGRQSANVTQNRQAINPSASTTAPRPAANAGTAGAGATAAATQRSGMSRFLGPIAGIAAGLGIAALLSSFGLSGAFLEFISSALLIGLVIFAVMYIVRRVSGSRMQNPLAAGAGNAAPRQSNNTMNYQAAPAATATTASSAAAPASVAATVSPAIGEQEGDWFVPANFNTFEFLQNAKKQFVSIQGLWDSGGVDGLKEFLTDDLIAELSPQITAQAGSSKTEVVLLNAELLGIEKVHEGHLASVRFSGMLKEQADQPAFRFEEVWNLYKSDAQGSGWLLAGIQQIPVENAS